MVFTSSLEYPDKKKFLSEVKNFHWDDPYLFKYYLDQIFWRCILNNGLLQYLDLLILSIFLQYGIYQLIGVPKTKESFWAKWRTFIGMTLTYLNIILIKYFKDASLIMGWVGSLNFVILRHVRVISRKKRQLQKSYNVDYIGPPCSRTNMYFQKLVKII